MLRTPRYVLLGAVLLIALALRLYALDWGVPGQSHFWSYQPDEAKTFEGLGNAPFFHPYDGANGPAFLGLYGLNTLIGGIAGLYPVVPTVPELKENPAALTRLYLWNRLLSAVLGVLSVWVLYLTARRTGLGAIGVFSSIGLLAILPEAVLISHYIRPQVLNTLLTLLFVFELCRVVDGSGGEMAMAIWSVAAASSEYTLGILILFGGLAVVWFNRSTRRWAIGLLSVFPLFYNVWMAPRGFLAALKTNQRFWSPFSFTAHELITLLVPAVSAVVLFAALLSIGFVGRKPQRAVLLLLALLIGFTYFAIGQPYARRFAPLFPLMCLGIGAMLDGLPNPRLAFAFIPLLMIEPGLRTAAVLQTMVHGDTRTEARGWIDSHVPPSSAIGFENWFFMPHLSVDRYSMIQLHEGQIPPNLPYILTGEFNSPSPDQLRRSGFVKIYELEYPHSAFGVIFNDARWPEDMRYTNPSIYLYRRKGP